MKIRHLCLWTTIGLLALGAVAQANTSVVTSPAEYMQLCQRVNAVTGRSIEGIRSSLGDLGGKYVEICGKILGKAHPAGTKTETISVYLQCEEDSCFVPCPPDIPEIQPGRSVRMLVHLATEPRDISDCSLAGVIEHPGFDEGPPAARGGDSRVEIGEAARGVRDRAPEPASLTSTPQSAIGPVTPTAPAAPAAPAPPAGTAAPRSALPPQMRGLPTIGRPSAPQPVQPATYTTATAPPKVAWASQQQSYDQVVQVWVKWVRGINPDLSPEQADLIVRWVLYHCAAQSVDHRLMFSVIRFESDFSPKCISSAGAMGLCQLMPCNVHDFGLKDPWDVAENIRGGVSELASYLRQYAGRSNYEQTVLALACYNAGSGAVAKYGGVPPYDETQSYVRKVPKLFADLVKQGYP